MSKYRDYRHTGFWDFLILLGIVSIVISERWESVFILGGLFIVGLVLFARKLHRDKIEDRKLMKRAAQAQAIQDERRTERDLRLANRTKTEVDYDRKHPEFSEFF
jgi:hypothetical protein